MNKLTLAEIWLNKISEKGSFLVNTTNNEAVSYEEAIALCLRNVVNVFEERGCNTGRRIATWMYNSETGVGTITSPHVNKPFKAKGKR